MDTPPTEIVLGRSTKLLINITTEMAATERERAGASPRERMIPAVDVMTTSPRQME
jgi:hypothetical protein